MVYNSPELGAAHVGNGNPGGAYRLAWQIAERLGMMVLPHPAYGFNDGMTPAQTARRLKDLEIQRRLARNSGTGPIPIKINHGNSTIRKAA